METIKLLEIPLSLYIHLPWCVRKCPYCDFNSHAASNPIPEDSYIRALLHEIDAHAALKSRPIQTLFLGGGTPSLFSAKSIQHLFEGLAERFGETHRQWVNRMEITMEANPGTFEIDRFYGYRDAGVNRISIGVQSFENKHLKRLGRIHHGQEAIKAIEASQALGFDHINVDLMHGLPDQSEAAAIQDIQTAIDLKANHLSWYQLTIEPNTEFAKFPPKLPDDDLLWRINQSGLVVLQKAGFQQYETSAYHHAERGQPCAHNMNYWQFGDYIGLGAGAHSKWTQADGSVIRQWNKKQPNAYMQNPKSPAGNEVLSKADLPFEFIMNALRLTQGVESQLFQQRTGLPLAVIKAQLTQAVKSGLMEEWHTRLKTTEQGRWFLNDCLLLFMKENQ